MASPKSCYKTILGLLEKEKDALEKRLRLFGDVGGRFGLQLKEVREAIIFVRQMTRDHPSSS